MTEKKVNAMIDLHEKWLKGVPGGKQMEVSDTNFSPMVIKNRNLSKAKITHMLINNCTFENVVFDNADFSTCSFRFSSMIGCTSDGADLSSGTWMDMSIKNCHIINCDVRFCDFRRTKIENSWIDGLTPKHMGKE